MFIVNNRKFFFILSALLIIGSIFSIYFYGLNFGIDFKGGSILEISYPNTRPDLEEVKGRLNGIQGDADILGIFSVIPSGDSNYVIKTKELTPVAKTLVLQVLGEEGNTPTEVRFNSIGPVVGNQLRSKAMTAIAVVVLCIVLFITFAFRKVSLPVASWKYGLATIVALAHDVIIPTGVFVAWTHFHEGTSTGPTHAS
ncbi:MAG TPA: hypothetical protein VGC58_01225 [Candidatus Paceibacterota bacterium]